MPRIHQEILTSEQLELLPLIKSFSQEFGLVGGTAIALFIGHRRSIDFNLFTDKEFDNWKIRRKIFRHGKIDGVLRDEDGQYTVVIHKVRITFFSYPFKINFSKSFNKVINLPDLLTLAAMKAYALGRRAKWKDYVDLYVIMRDYYDIHKIIKRARRIFGLEFNEKLFRAQFSYFKDIDYTEKVDYLKGFEVGAEIIKKKLADFSLG